MQKTEHTLLDYFAAHAPAEPQPWFKPRMKDRPKAPETKLLRVNRDIEYDDRQEELQRLCDSWRSDPCWDLLETESDYARPEREALQAYAVMWTRFWADGKEWQTEYAKQRLVQWPYAWAAEQVSLRDALGIGGRKQA